MKSENLSVYFDVCTYYKMEPKLNDDVDNYEKTSEKLTILNNIAIFLFLFKGKEKNLVFFFIVE